MFKRVSLSLDERLVEKIDKDRDDVTRSRFLQRLIERSYNGQGGKK